MKKIAASLLFFVCSTGFFNTAGAAGINTFYILSQYLTNNSVAVPNPGVPTPIEFFVTARVDLASAGGWEDNGMTVTLILDKSGVEENLSTPRIILPSEYSESTGYADLKLSAIIPANTLNGVIKLKYSWMPRHPDQPKRTEYSSIVYTMLTGVNVFNEGQFIRNNNSGEVFLYMDGGLRYIPAYETVLLKIFDFNESLLHPYSDTALQNIPRKAPFSADCEIINNSTTGKVYLREGNLIRHIYTLSAFDKYHFSWEFQRFVTDISGYELGSLIQ